MISLQCSPEDESDKITIPPRLLSVAESEESKNLTKNDHAENASHF